MFELRVRIRVPKPGRCADLALIELTSIASVPRSGDGVRRMSNEMW